MNPRCVENEMPQMDGMNMNMCDNKMGSQGAMWPPIYECPMERVCERFIVHEVPQE